ncbi:uncharacterized protein M421DRAFT_94032 [Didymella exigua CBS 183.55]|uniref:Non-haem dioxygenase N-terminal domain-containing protein n=1 Tax=Didymella exigua CBS 183.55 TaxID=1150837 RepID=A0A6A5RFK1_9PLEO|nr:uncharacterized protein M421DRAFT_94032 [Didymella exigua CBS 183.55]KAF1926502.1 hypothetical protein M421DRAFT_94032 [Didymella exigua CBS 183.55]
MARISAALLFAGIATAQASNYTTTAWMTNFADTDRYGYVASVIDADSEHMTLSLDFDANTNTTALNIGGPGGNYTFGKTAFTIKEAMTRYEPTPTDGDMNLQLACTQPAQAGADVTCDGKIGDGYARFARCNEYQTTQTDRSPVENVTRTITHTYGTGIWGSAGTETITQEYNFPLQTETTTPAWCTSDEVPETELESSFTTTAAEFAVYQIVIYAGQEKLSAFSGSSVDVSTIAPSSSVASSSSSSFSGSPESASASATASAPPQSTGAAGKMNAVIPALAGIGVAAVMVVRSFDVSTAPARPPRDDEIPLIDLSGFDGNLDARRIIAKHVCKTAENTEFSYVENYGIDGRLIEDALSQAQAFLAQPLDKKEPLLPEYTGPAVGYRGLSSTQINRTESRNRKETFAVQYDVLSSISEWLDAFTMPGTLVVNVSDFLQRLSNDRFRSTVHRLCNRAETSRYFMPFFFGFNADAVCEVVSTCVGEENLTKYLPISYVEGRRLRFALASKPQATSS